MFKKDAEVKVFKKKDGELTKTAEKDDQRYGVDDLVEESEKKEKKKEDEESKG